MTLERARRLVFGLALASFVLSFFHRTAPAAIAGELTRAFDISSTVLGTLAATYFYVYTVLQVPVGVMADTLGPRRILATGSAIAAAGSLLFALAPVWQVAAAGRTLVGIGVSVAFISVLKLSAVWFPPQRFATLAGVTMFAGNLGAVVAGAPLAWVVTQTSWRVVFAALAVLSGLIAIASWLRVRDRPEDLGFAPVNPSHAHVAAVPWRTALAGVLANPATWPPFVVNFGVGGSFLAFAGLWAVPYLQQVHGMTRVSAAQHTSLLLLGVAFGSMLVGAISDRLAQPAGSDAGRGAALRADLASVARPCAVAELGHAGLVCVDGTRDTGVHAVVDDRQGSEPAAVCRHCDVRRQHRHFPRHGRAAAAGRLGARSRPGCQCRISSMGQQPVRAGRRSRDGRHCDLAARPATGRRQLICVPRGVAGARRTYGAGTTV